MSVTETFPRREDPPAVDGRIALLAQISTDTALELPPGLSFVAWQGVGVALCRIERGIQWWLGDWWRYGEREYGEAAAQAAPTGYALKTVQNAASVATSFPPERRRPQLTYSHHAETQGLPEEEQEELLDRAEDEGWTSHDLRWRAKAARERNGDPAPDPIPDFECPACHHRWSGRPRP